jgi:putative ABC transport system ATP-binding protein
VAARQGYPDAVSNTVGDNLLGELRVKCPVAFVPGRRGRRGEDTINEAFRLDDVHYRNILALPGLVIPAGTFYCIAGESGSGKTTLLKLLNNLLTCDRGKVLFFDRDILTVDPVALRRRVVMVPQASFIFPATVRENIGFAFHYAQKAPPGDADTARLLSRLGLPEVLDRDAASLSGGEKQRLALARALLLDPAVLLLDEPTASLDEDTANKVLHLLARWKGAPGKTLVMVTHARGAAERFADILLTLSRGRVAGLVEGGKRRV